MNEAITAVLLFWCAVCCSDPF